MEQLSGLDAAFVHQDSARTPMHVTAILLYQAGQRTLDLPTLRGIIDQRLLHLPLFQRRMRRVTLDVDTPYWVAAGPVDWRYHLQQEDAGGLRWSQYQSRLGRFHARRMNLAKPLWQLRLVYDIHGVPGIEEPCQALLLKAHHAAIDGISLASLLHQLHDQGRQDAPPAGRVPPPPSRWQLWSRVNQNNLLRQVKLAGTVGRLLPALTRFNGADTKEKLPPVRRFRALFNAQVGSGRSVGVVLLPREEVQQVKRAVRRVTYNDIAASIIAGALRRYLAGRDELPDKSLVAGMPINLRGADSGRSGSNQIATMAVGLGTQVADPIARTRLLHRYAVAGKRNIDALGTGTIMDISDSVNPAILAGGLRTMAVAGSLGSMPVPFHTMISNVPGPAGPASLAGLPLLACAGLGPVRDNMGLFQIISSSDHFFSLTFNACSKLLPDADHYRRLLLQSHEELLAAATEG
ncbi:DUF1298 domain-containing protein [Seongchinamella sediminis]|uniref:diacylglycerol O-acyltransferase n=1 Tax=Seongchinamella sediminis TaxID=2283635 RepID=A0A3L7DVW3_9GAMM|nr:wax ester/triacylglycerol synthase domain-containing protein [Seongchinamella sediminis]RLQ21718.1 DUF1298 domain-containing protein [Seongchinamella sediminis]